MNIKRYSLIFILALLVLFVSITASVQAQEEELPFTVKVVDAASGAAIKNIIVTIESEGGVSEQKIITGSEGSGCTILPPGTYRLKAQFTIFGIPIQISSTEITLDEPTEFIYTISTFIIPIEYIPTAVYGTTGLLALSGVYGTGKRLLGLRGISRDLKTGARSRAWKRKPMCIHTKIGMELAVFSSNLKGSCCGAYGASREKSCTTATYHLVLVSHVNERGLVFWCVHQSGVCHVKDVGGVCY